MINAILWCVKGLFRNFLPKDIIFYHLPHNNTNKNYVASTMHNDFIKQKSNNGLF